jgi:hypothetical protein
MTNPTVSFIKQEGLWYADLPEYIEQGGSFASCLMVAGAPELIEMMAGKDAKRATFEVNVEWFAGFEAILNKEVEGEIDEEEGSWATYLTTVYKRDSHNTQVMPRVVESTSFYVSLCPVNKWVFGGQHPDSIYLKLINKE